MSAHTRSSFFEADFVVVVVFGQRYIKIMLFLDYLFFF